MQIAIALYPSFDVLDATGPYEVLGNVPGHEVSFVAQSHEPVTDELGRFRLVPHATFAELPSPDVLIVPGTTKVAAAIEHGGLLPWIREAHATSTWTVSVCTGALLLGAAGLLDGVRSTTHWAAHDQLASFGAIPVDDRFVIDGKMVSSAGVSAGIDMALALVEQLAGREVAQAVQLGLEYDPAPPFSAGHPRSAPPEITELVSAMLTTAATSRLTRS